MSTARTWTICEVSGRWAAALRLAFERLPVAQPAPRLYEVRTVGELERHFHEHDRDFALIEVGPTNLTEVLQLLIRRGPQAAPFVALLADGADREQDAAATVSGESAPPTIADLLWEFGAVEVVESPRRLRGLLALHHRLSAASGHITGGSADTQPLADWAWSTLPWQDS